MTTFRAAQVTSPRGPLALVDRTLTDPAPGTVRVAVEACGICHTDSVLVDDMLPGLQFPVTSGHEIAGRIDALGEGVEGWREGERMARLSLRRCGRGGLFRSLRPHVLAPTRRVPKTRRTALPRSPEDPWEMAGLLQELAI